MRIIDNGRLHRPGYLEGLDAMNQLLHYHGLHVGSRGDEVELIEWQAPACAALPPDKGPAALL